MNEAHQMYDDLLEGLSPILPRTVYQDVRRVRTLAWAVTGLCLTHRVCLGAWAEVVDSRAQYAASRVRRLSRWLHHPAIHPQEWYQPLLQAALVDWQQANRLYIALDTTALTPFVLIRASLVYCHRAIPLAWRAMRHKSTQVSFEAYQPVLDQVRAIVPPCLVITLLADRGFVHEQLLHYLHTQQWHFRLRLPGDTLRLSRSLPSETCVHLLGRVDSSRRCRFSEPPLGRSLWLWPACLTSRMIPGLW
jgi:hypothetical protein